MPAGNEHYINSVIYSIQHRDIPDLIYIGSTSCFSTRLKSHNYNCNNIKSKLYDNYLYKMIRKTGGWDNYLCSIYEKYPCFNKGALLIREDCILSELKPILNKNKAYCSIEDKKQYQIEYKQKNKEKLVKYYKLWKLMNKDKLEVYKQRNKNYHRNPETIEYMKKYYQQNKEKYKEWYQQNKEKCHQYYMDKKMKKNKEV